MRRPLLLTALALAWTAPGAAADYPNKPAHIVFRDAKILCPMILRDVVRTGNGKQGVANILVFAVERKYSRSDTKALLRICNLYAQSGSF